MYTHIVRNCVHNHAFVHVHYAGRPALKEVLLKATHVVSNLVFFETHPTIDKKQFLFEIIDFDDN